MTLRSSRRGWSWISGQRKSYDEVSYLQKYVPRRPGSRWSQINVAKVEQLKASGRMRPSGLAEVEAAEADGRWAAAYQSQRNVTVPPDLQEALAANPPAAQAFEALSKTERYAVILKLANARTATTRATHLRRAMSTLQARRHLRELGAGQLRRAPNHIPGKIEESGKDRDERDRQPAQECPRLRRHL